MSDSKSKQPKKRMHRATGKKPSGRPKVIPGKAPTLSVRIPQDLYDRLQARALSGDQSVSAMVREVLLLAETAARCPEVPAALFAKLLGGDVSIERSDEQPDLPL